MKSGKTTVPRRRIAPGYRRGEILYGYLFIAPFYLLFLVFQLYPMIWSFVLSFYEWNGISPQTFVGLQNYQAVLRDGMFRQAMLNTLVYLAANLLCIMPLSVLLGQMYGIPEYRLPKHYVRSVAAALAAMGIRLVTRTCVGKDITIEEIEAANDTVFLEPAPGSSRFWASTART